MMQDLMSSTGNSSIKRSMSRSMYEILKKTLTLSHGQASVERSFSVNKTLLVDNLSVIILVSRFIHDHMNANNLFPHTLEITAPLRRHVRSSRQRCQQHLDDQTEKIFLIKNSLSQKL